VPGIVEYTIEMTVIEQINGIDLEQAFGRVSARQSEGIKLQASWGRHPETLDNQVPKSFAVGILCTDRELLFTRTSTYPQRGPFATVGEYRTHYKALWGLESRFEDDVITVFDHMG
jgi:hypothetical protein